MPKKEHLRLVRFVRQQAEDDVRGVLRYRDDMVELLYKRDDVDGEQFKNRVELTIRQAQTKYSHNVDASSVGRTAEHVELFDGVVVVYLHEGPNEASVFSIDMDVAGNLAMFLDRCRDVVGPHRPRKRLPTDGQQHERGSGES